MDEVGYKKPTIWQKADELAYQVYAATKSFPRQEACGITSKLRKAALSRTFGVFVSVRRPKNKDGMFLGSVRGRV